MKLMPQEIEVRYILPALRKELAIALSKDMKQKEVADILNITPAAVSQYHKDKRGQTNLKIKKEIKISKMKIMENRFSAQTELLRLTKKIKDTHTICDIHRMHDCVPKNCDFCYENDN
jgi:predicted transcriptional regulator